MSSLFMFFIFANLPWFSHRLFIVIPMKQDKSLLARLGELVVYYFVSLWISRLFEQHYSGMILPQQWEFYIITICLFLVLSVPGLIYHYQWKKLRMYR